MKLTSIVIPLGIAGLGAAAAGRAKQRTPFTFKNRSVLITGGSRGLGLIMARLLAAEGARLTLLARGQAALDQAAEELTARGAEVLTIVCDVTDREQAQAAVERAVERFGGIDVLINNAGIIQSGPVEHMTLEDFEAAMATHMWAPLYTMMAAIPHMRQAGGGRIVNISSIGGKIAVPHLLPYSASKFALVGLSDGMRAELAKDHIHVTTVAPGLLRTGSPLNAFFKGDHEREFAWFALLDTLPLTAIDAKRAARQIIEACRDKNPELTITIQARAAIVANTLFPGLFAKGMQIYGRLLPGPRGLEGDQLKDGWASRSSFTTSSFMQPMYRNAAENNEVPRSQEHVGSPT